MRDNERDGEGIKRFLLRGFLGSGALRICFTLLNLAIAIFLARALGPKGYGIYAFAYAQISLLAIPAQMGLPTLVMREVARYHLKKEWGNLKGILRRANQAVVIFSALLVMGAIVVVWFLNGGMITTQMETSAWALLLVPLISLGKIRAAALRGFNKVVLGQLPEMLFLPALLLLFICIALWQGNLTPPKAMGLHGLAAGFAFVIGLILLQRAIPLPLNHALPTYKTKDWFNSILPLSLISGMQVINSQAAIVILGFFASSEDVGLYRAAFQAANIVSLSLIAINAVIAPQITRLYHEDDKERLQRMVTWSARVILAVSLPLATILIFFGELILKLVFGDGYVDGSTVLIILCLGQLINAAMGSVSLLLNMTGHERDTAKGLMIAAISNILLNLILIPSFGIEGAAAATALSLAGWNILLNRQVKRRIGVDSSAFRIKIKRLNFISSHKDK